MDHHRVLLIIRSLWGPLRNLELLLGVMDLKMVDLKVLKEVVILLELGIQYQVVIIQQRKPMIKVIYNRQDFHCQLDQL